MATRKRPNAKPAPLPPKGEHEENICFTIMPFGGWFDDYYENIYMPAIEQAGFTPRRADDLYRPSTIVNDIWIYTQKAKVVLADLSGKNPNVFYELGLAHALAKPAILITESMDDVPFDLRALRVLEYNKNDPKWGDILQEKITKSIQEVSGSPLQAVLPAFLSVKPELKTKSITENEKQLLELRQEVELLRNEVFRTRRLRTPSIDPEQAEGKMRRFLMLGMSERSIKLRLRDLGIPLDWIDKKLSELRPESQELFSEGRTELDDN